MDSQLSSKLKSRFKKKDKEDNHTRTSSVNSNFSLKSKSSNHSRSSSNTSNNSTTSKVRPSLVHSNSHLGHSSRKGSHSSQSSSGSRSSSQNTTQSHHSHHTTQSHSHHTTQSHSQSHHSQSHSQSNYTHKGLQKFASSSNLNPNRKKKYKEDLLTHDCKCGCTSKHVHHQKSFSNLKENKSVDSVDNFANNILDFVYNKREVNWNI